MQFMDASESAPTMASVGLLRRMPMDNDVFRSLDLDTLDTLSAQDYCTGCSDLGWTYYKMRLTKRKLLEYL